MEKMKLVIKVKKYKIKNRKEILLTCLLTNLFNNLFQGKKFLFS